MSRVLHFPCCNDLHIKKCLLKVYRTVNEYKMRKSASKQQLKCTIRNKKVQCIPCGCVRMNKYERMQQQHITDDVISSSPMA